jgi:hypothetical protein
VLADVFTFRLLFNFHNNNEQIYEKEESDVLNDDDDI